MTRALDGVIELRAAAQLVADTYDSWIARAESDEHISEADIRATLHSLRREHETNPLMGWLQGADRAALAARFARFERALLRRLPENVQ